MGKIIISSILFIDYVQNFHGILPCYGLNCKTYSKFGTNENTINMKLEDIRIDFVEVFDKFQIKLAFWNGSKIDDNRPPHAAINDKDGVVINDYPNGYKNTNIGDDANINRTNIKREDKNTLYLNYTMMSVKVENINHLQKILS